MATLSTCVWKFLCRMSSKFYLFTIISISFFPIFSTKMKMTVCEPEIPLQDFITLDNLSLTFWHFLFPEQEDGAGKGDPFRNLKKVIYTKYTVHQLNTNLSKDLTFDERIEEGKWGLKKNLVPRHPCLSCKLSRPTCTFFSGGWWTLLVKLWKCFNHQSQNRKLYFQTQQFANSRGQLAHCKSEVDELKPSHVASKCQIFGDISNFL